MPEMEVIPESTFRKESFCAGLEEMGIKMMGEGDKASLKAYFKFDDELPPLTFFIFNKNGKCCLTDKEGSYRTHTLNLGQIIDFLRVKKGIKTFVNLDEGSESMRTEPSIIGMKMKFDAHTSTRRAEDGTTSEGFTNFQLVDVIPCGCDTSKPAEKPAEKSAKDLSVWKTHLSEVLKTITLDEKGINKSVVQKAKAAGKTPEQLGLTDRKKALDQLVSEKFLTMNAENEYELVVA